MLRILVAALALTIIVTTASSAMTLKDFKRFSVDEQSIYIGAQVNMLAYKFATEGDTAKARCIRNYYFGEPGKEPPGPRAVSVEIAVAAARDPEKYHVEGVIIGLTDQVCAKAPPAPAPPPRR